MNLPIPKWSTWHSRRLLLLGVVLLFLQLQTAVRDLELHSLVKSSELKSVEGTLSVPHETVPAATTSATSTTLPLPLTRNAYVFLLAGCDPKKDPEKYYGPLVNIFLAIYNLRRSGSKAEVVVMIQMAAKSTFTELPSDDLELFSKFMNNNAISNSSNTSMVHIQYLPKPKTDTSSNYQAIKAKFAVLNLTHYNRVLFMDSSIFPLCNLDYLFDYSNRGILKDNVIIASGTEPASGGFFMLRPQVGDYEHVLSILKQQKQQNRVMMIQQNNASNAEFDVILGWGHAIQPPDQWQILDKGGTVEGRLWTFHGSNADQGLLYHWVKYVKRHVSIFVYDQLQNWISPPSFSSVGDGRIVAPQRRTTDAMPMNPVIMEWNTSTYNLTNFGCPIHYRFQPKSRPVPYKDFYHFTGKQKPWEQMDIPKDIPSAERAVWAHDFWFHLLRKAIVELNLNMNITTLLDKRKPVMKPFAVLRDIRRPNNSKGVTLGLASKERSRNTSNSTRSGKPNAYAFLVAGCNPDEPSYQGFLYNVFLAIYTLWRSGSNAEFVVMIQMGAKTNYTELPKEHLKLFSKLSNTVVHFRYLRKPKVDSFYYAMLSKFAVLTLTSYNRVLFMDADILPLCNLDYLFDYSDRGILKDNAVIATATEPSNGGFFMLRPEVGDYEHIMSIVKRQHDQASKNGWHSFDYTLGWGHAIQPPDEWVNLGKENNRGLNWKFHGGFADQGLLYHWVKYVKMHVSIFVYDIIQNWGPPKNEPSAQAGNDTTVNPVMESNISAFDIAGFGCPTRYRFQASTRPPPYKDHYHFTGSKKPWERNSIPEDLENAEKAVWPADLWFHWMRQANVELDLNLNISSILNRQEPVLGRYPLRSDILVTARAYANSTHARN